MGLNFYGNNFSVKVTARKNRHGNFVGYLTAYDGKGLKLWTKSTTIMRLYKQDAIDDGIKDARDAVHWS